MSIPLVDGMKDDLMALEAVLRPLNEPPARAKVSVFLDLHRKNRQLGRMPAQEQTHCVEPGGRPATLERPPTGDGPRT
ncbi:hypothetical protein [Streptomyces chiangmaiensis]|uniref:Uncharacterized protein n=1 Tax=Streptomyces chiangmaiensis TaxID=766497 RepID=A0ABU7FJ72_9ACTN|nr:hypothetical protein [Streptomyces chiangmaiensis]MED7824150.1 hypothetical protein [Streptomyces chiangmaiensis]